MRIRHGEVICEGTVETVRYLEQLINKSDNRFVLHDGSKGRNWMTGDYTARSAFSRQYGIRVNGDFLKLRLWYDKRDGSARVSALPVHMTKLRQSLPGFGQALWEVAKSGENFKKGGNGYEETNSVHQSVARSVAGVATGKARV